VQVPSAVFIQPPMGTVGLTEEHAREQISGDVDVYVSKFRPMKNTITGRKEKTLIKVLVEVATDKVRLLLTDKGSHQESLQKAPSCASRVARRRRS